MDIRSILANDTPLVDVAEYVLTHLLVQGQAAMRGKSCAYRDYEGRSCAVGCLISDEDYNRETPVVALPKYPDMIFSANSEDPHDASFMAANPSGTYLAPMSCLIELLEQSSALQTLGYHIPTPLSFLLEQLQSLHDRHGRTAQPFTLESIEGDIKQFMREAPHPALGEAFERVKAKVEP